MRRLLTGLAVWAAAAFLLGAALTLTLDLTPDAWGWAVWVVGSWLAGVPLTAPLVALVAVVWRLRRDRRLGMR